MDRGLMGLSMGAAWKKTARSKIIPLELKFRVAESSEFRQF
jgi:hypothetical protein